MIEYSEIIRDDLGEVIALYEKYLNSGEYIERSMRKAFDSEEYIGYKACDNGRIVGFFCGQKEIEFTYPHPELEKEIRYFAGNRKLYTPDGLLILDEYRKHGIAGELIRRMKKCLLEKQIELALVELWIYPDGTIPARTPLKDIGEAVYEKRISMFYSRLREYGITCPICGAECKCGALIQLLEVKETQD